MKTVASIEHNGQIYIPLPDYLEIIKIMEHYKTRSEKLQAENAKLRGCVEFYAVNGLANIAVGEKFDVKLSQEFYINGLYARQVLKELDEK